MPRIITNRLATADLERLISLLATGTALRGANSRRAIRIDADTQV
jgi:hypothetical protein